MRGSNLSSGFAWRSRQDGQKGAKPVCQLHLHFPWGGWSLRFGGECTGCIVMSLADKCLHPISPFDRELHFNAANISQIFNFSSQIQPFTFLRFRPKSFFFVQTQLNEDLKYEDKKQAISCDLVQVWASHWEEGLLQNMSEALQEILRPLLIQIHTLPLCGTMPSFQHWYRLSRNNTTLRAQDVLWGGIGRDFTVAPPRRPPGYFDTLPTLPSFRLHF